MIKRCKVFEGRTYYDVCDESILFKAKYETQLYLFILTFQNNKKLF